MESGEKMKRPNVSPNRSLKFIDFAPTAYQNLSIFFYLMLPFVSSNNVILNQEKSFKTLLS